MKKKKINRKKGILFWITGLSGSGKTTISKKIKKSISNLYGPTILVNGDNLRKIFGFNKFNLSERIILSKKFCNFAKYITDQKINLIFSVVAMMDKPRIWNKKNIDNYFEIFIKTKIDDIIKAKKKKIYHKKNVGAIVGVDIKAELPKKPDIIITNNFNKSSNILAKELIGKIKLLYNGRNL